MSRAFSLKSPTLWALAFGGLLAASCDERGSTSVCPPLPLYQTYPLADAAPADAASVDSPEVQLALEAAYDAGCATRPGEFPAGAGAGGEGGDGAGSSSPAGEHAGAAGEH